MGKTNEKAVSQATAPCRCGCARLVPVRADGLAHHSCKDQRWATANRGHKTPCHVWLLAKTPTGYGLERTGDGGPMDYAHRNAFQRSRGPIPDGIQIDHLCRVRECVNPDHLDLVTQTENLRRGA